MIKKKFVKHWKKIPVKSIKWSAKAGSFKAKSCKIEFTLPAFHEHREIACNAYVDESHHKSNNYDMIIGRDIMHSLGINLLFDTADISWEHAKVHMQHPEMLKSNWVDTLEHYSMHMIPIQQVQREFKVLLSQNIPLPIHL
jgi:hypothetical protein